MNITTWSRRVFIGGIVSALLLTGCAMQRPAYSPVQGEKFRSDALLVERVYVVLSFPAPHNERIGEPLQPAFTTAFKEKGFQAAVELQVLSPLALDSGIRLHGVAAYKPNAIVIVKLSESHWGATSSYWRLHFDILDGRGKGVWRGQSTVYRLSGIEETTNHIARDLVKRLSDEAVIRRTVERAT